VGILRYIRTIADGRSCALGAEASATRKEHEVNDPTTAIVKTATIASKNQHTRRAEAPKSRRAARQVIAGPSAGQDLPMDFTQSVNVSMPFLTERHGRVAWRGPSELPDYVPPNSKLAYTIREFMAASGLGRTSTYALINAKHLTIVKVGRRTLITAHSARKLLGGQ
jgi:hypothetical protein